MIELRELVARALFQDQFRLRNWDAAKLWQKKHSFVRADVALKRAGLENVNVESKVTEKVRRNMA